MLNKKIIFTAILLISLLSLSAVSAADDVSDIVDSSDDAIVESVDDVPNAEPALEESDENVLSDGETGTFTDLKQLIQQSSASEITLDRDYAFDDQTDDINLFKYGIVIDRELTVYGNGKSINANNAVRIFFTRDEPIKFYDLTFIGGNSLQADGPTEGGAIFASLSSRTEVINCNFINNTATGGGALFRVNALGCTFTNNNATYGGAVKGIEIDGDEDPYTAIRNCTFTNNTARIGGAAYECRVYESNFTENHAIDYGGALISCGAEYCNFNENTARLGGAMDRGWTVMSNFTKNHADEYGGALYGVYAKNCTFLQNSAGKGSGAAHNTALTQEIHFSTFIFNRAPEDVDVAALELCGECTFIIPTIEASDLVTTYNSGAEFPIGLSTPDMTFDGENTTVSIYKNDVLVLNDTALTGSEWAVNLEPGVYKIVLGIPNSNVVPVTKIISVEQKPTKITASEVTATYNEDEDLVITLTDNDGNPLSGKQITVDLDGEANYTTDENGQVKVAVGKLVPDTYIATISFAGDTQYKESSTAAKVTVKKVTSEISADAVTTTYNEDEYLVITLRDNEGNPLSDMQITVDLNGEANYTTDENGQVKVAVGKLVPDTYTATISFAGDDYYTESSTTAEVTVEKITPQVTASAKTFKFEDKTKKYTVTLKDDKGNALKNTKVSLKVNGKTYTATTNSNGVATFKLSKLTKKGTYNTVITYAGDKYYKEVTKKAKITVKAPVWETIARGSKKHAMVKKIQRALKKNGFYLSYNGHYLKIDGIYHIYTEMAVKQFQKAKKLKVNGKVDYATAKKLKLI